jgi:ABC transport system ATP-binding/permease protein
MFSALLKIDRGNSPTQTFSIAGDTVTIGRAPDNDIILGDANISRHHAKIRWQGDRYFLVDLGSSDGTTLNRVALLPHIPQPLEKGDTFEIGRVCLRFCVADSQSSHLEVPDNVTMMGVPDTLVVAHLDLRDRTRLTLGRDPQNDTTIQHPSVSRFHAAIDRSSGSFILQDLNSTNGTFVNGKAIDKPRVLRVGDNIRIGPCRFILNVDETLLGTNEAGNLRLDALDLHKVVGKEIDLLDGISLSIQPREFVAIAGVSGGGKSTLLEALNGFHPATSGTILVNGIDLYKHFNAYRTQIGYVPQKDIVHADLTVEQALDYAARLRMPADTTTAERRSRIHAVLLDLGLAHRRNVAIKSLSGGQLKRVSIGVELLTQPSLFFLDEATSGLDPGTEADLMQLLRKLADGGRTILLVTHATENVTLCDRVIFMARGGHLAYFGSPQEALTYFGVDRFNQIYHKVERELSPQEWSQRYRESFQYQKYIAEPQQHLDPTHSKTYPKRPRMPIEHIFSWRQFAILFERNLAILVRDRASAILTLVVPPMLGLLDLFAWKRDLFNVKTGSANLAITMLFTSALIAVMVGSLATMREIVKERDIYQRERAIGLQLFPYIFSKVGVGILLAMYQATVFVMFKELAVTIPGSAFLFYIALVLAAISGVVLGLLVSAISPNQNVAPLIALLFIVPQILFSGGVLPIEGLVGNAINRLSLTKWSFETLVTITTLGKDVAADSCWDSPKSERESLSDKEKEKCKCLGSNVFKGCQFPGIGKSYDTAVDEPEPPKPEKLPSLPKPPQLQSFQAQQQYQTDLEAYQAKVDRYQEDLDSWQDRYSNWKEKREKAIGEAESLIDKTHQEYGKMFDLDLRRHWSILGGFIAAMLGAILGLQKRKDLL